jgi:hypothetical protein
LELKGGKQAALPAAAGEVRLPPKGLPNLAGLPDDGFSELFAPSRLRGCLAMTRQPDASLFRRLG